MGVYKEGFYAVEMIEKQSKQIYEDAADYGALTKKDDTLWNTVKHAVNWYGKPHTKKIEKYSTGVTVSKEISLMNENTSEIETYRITFVGVNNRGIKIKGERYDGYFYVEQLKKKI